MLMKDYTTFILKMFEYPQAKICPRGQNVSVPSFCILLMHFIYTHDDQTQNFLTNDSFRFSNTMNNTRIINTVNIQTHRQIMTTITNIILKFKAMIKKLIVAQNCYYL